MKNTLTSLLLLLTAMVGLAQTPTVIGKRTSTLNGQTVTIDLYSDGSRKQSSTPATGGITARIGSTVRVPYTPEPKQTFNATQFGLDKYYSPTFRFSVDWNPNVLSVAQRKRQGINLFNSWALTDQEKFTLPFGDGMSYLTESGIHGQLEGPGYFETTLANYEAYIWDRLPAVGYPGPDVSFKLLVYNLESSNDWSKANYSGQGKWPSWESAKNRQVICESDGQVRTLEQIDQQGLFGIEASIRRANRRIISYKALRKKAAGPIFISDGSSMYQGQPRLEAEQENNPFLNDNADVSHIGGTSNGTITLNGRTYTGVTGSHYNHEDSMWGYYYLFDYELPEPDRQDIFVNQLPGKTNHPYLWSKMGTRHIVADEKGYLQLNRHMMMLNQGQTRGIYRMIEPIFEGNEARLYWPDLHPLVTGKSEWPKVWQPPYWNYSRYMVIRFFAGNDNGWGFHMFNAPDQIRKEKIFLDYNFHWHTVTALFQARNDMQPYERWFTGSTLVEDPEVQLLGTGAFSAYTGTQAFNLSYGTYGVQKPAYMMRYKATADGWRVLIMGGMNQGWTSERIDVVRAPGGALNGNKFRVKLRGPSAQLYEFLVKNTDSNQTYEAVPVANTAFEKPGYSGRTVAAP